MTGRLLDVRTPLVQSDTIELGNRVYRKQVLPIGELNYKGRKLKFTPEYLRNVAAAFRRQAFDTVPIMLSDRDNSHTMALTAGGGEVMGLDVDETADKPGLYATVRLPKQAEGVVEDNRKVGVSVRIKENYERGDGEFFPAAMQHLLLTWDPRVTGMAPWEPVDLSDDDGELLDLSGLTWNTEEKEGNPMPQNTPAEGAGSDGAPDTAPARDNDALFQEFLEWQASRNGQADTVEVPVADDAEADAQGAEGADTAQAEGQDDADSAQAAEGAGPGFTAADVGISDDEFEEIAANALFGVTDDGADRQPAEVAASSDDDAVELSNADRDERYQALELSNRQLRQRLDAADYERERAQIVRSTGVPPHIVDLARPLLEGSGHSVELSNGEDVDAGEIVRGVFQQLGSTLKLLDLSQEIGQAPVSTEEQAAAEQRTARSQKFIADVGLNAWA